MMDNESTYLHLLAQGNQYAFKQLFDAYYPKVKAFVESIVKRTDVAENIAQDSFIKIWERREAFSPETGSIKSFSGYLYVIARNAALNYIRRGKEGLPIDDIYQDQTLTEEEYFAREQELIIQLVTKGMGESKRRIFEMSRYDGIDNDTIAATLNISKKTVENNLYLAMKEIRRILSGV